MVRDIKQLNLLVVHCSASPNGKWLNAQTIDGWHKERGFRRDDESIALQNSMLKSIGYHFVIYTNGAVATGRRIEEVGAHVKGFNLRSIGICMVGTDSYSPPQWSSLADLVGGLLKRYGDMEVKGHRDLSPDVDGDGVIEEFEWLKTCPGFDVAAWLAQDRTPLPGHVLSEYDGG